MREVERIADQLKKSFDGNAWHGDSLREILADVDAAKAEAKPVSGAHSIWELVLHTAAWARAALEVVSGQSEKLEADDWPALPEKGEIAWKQTLEDLWRVGRQLQEAILSMKDERLEEVVPGRDYTYYMLLHGVVQHSLYHGGQIAILKKA
jgi:uncharacterized damage-inducible protein DinB